MASTLAASVASHAGGGFVRGGAVGVGRVGGVGVWHRPYVARGAWYRGAPYGAAAVGAAALGGAAVGAAAAGAYPYYGGACGYYPYPPCYLASQVYGQVWLHLFCTTRSTAKALGPRHSADPDPAPDGVIE